MLFKAVLHIAKSSSTGFKSGLYGELRLQHQRSFLVLVTHDELHSCPSLVKIVDYCRKTDTFVVKFHELTSIKSSFL